jgi:hypothetical protein
MQNCKNIKTQKKLLARYITNTLTIILTNSTPPPGTIKNPILTHPNNKNIKKCSNDIDSYLPTNNSGLDFNFEIKAYVFDFLGLGLLKPSCMMKLGGRNCCASRNDGVTVLKDDHGDSLGETADSIAG